MTTTTEPIINQIEKMVNDIPGWSPVDQLYSLFLLAYSTVGIEGDIIEIGSWCGRSSSVLGLAAKLTGVNKIICVDLFPDKNDWIQNSDGSYSFKINYNNNEYSAYVEQTVWKEPFEHSILPVYKQNESLLDMFKENMDKLGFGNIIKPIKGNSTFIKQNVDDTFKCKFAFIDGDHGYTSVCNDIMNIEKYLVSGAWICFDDAFSSYGGIDKAIEEMIIDNPLYENGQQLTRKLFVARKK